MRWQGAPDLLLRHLLPQVTDFAGQLVDAGRITRLVIDSYDRELERYGGPVGLEVCEDLFHIDSVAVRSLLGIAGIEPTEVTVASTVHLLAGLGLNASERVAFYETQTSLTEDPAIGRLPAPTTGSARLGCGRLPAARPHPESSGRPWSRCEPG